MDTSLYGEAPNSHPRLFKSHRRKNEADARSSRSHGVVQTQIVMCTRQLRKIQIRSQWALRYMEKPQIDIQAAQVIPRNEQGEHQAFQVAWSSANPDRHVHQKAPRNPTTFFDGHCAMWSNPKLTYRQLKSHRAANKANTRSSRLPGIMQPSVVRCTRQHRVMVYANPMCAAPHGEVQSESQTTQVRNRDELDQKDFRKRRTATNERQITPYDEPAGSAMHNRRGDLLLSIDPKIL